MARIICDKHQGPMLVMLVCQNASDSTAGAPILGQYSSPHLLKPGTESPQCEGAEIIYLTGWVSERSLTLDIQTDFRSRPVPELKLHQAAVVATVFPSQIRDYERGVATSLDFCAVLWPDESRPARVCSRTFKHQPLTFPHHQVLFHWRNTQTQNMELRGPHQGRWVKRYYALERTLLVTVIILNVPTLCVTIIWDCTGLGLNKSRVNPYSAWEATHLVAAELL